MINKVTDDGKQNKCFSPSGIRVTSETLELTGSVSLKNGNSTLSLT